MTVAVKVQDDPTIDVTCLGEALIDLVAQQTDVSVGEATSFLKAAGGAPANVAVGVARLGGSSAFLGQVGDDPFGRFLRDTLSQNGVDTGGMRLDPIHRTGLAFVSLKTGGERDFCFFRNPSADMLYSPTYVDQQRIRNAWAFHFGSITLIQDPSRTATMAAAELARSASRLISYDPNLRPALWPNLGAARSAILEAMSSTDLVKVSEEELTFLTNETDPSIGMRVLTELYPNIRLLVVTLGREGCRWRRGTDTGASPGFPVHAIDTTGAGDAFVAGMLMGMRNVVSQPTDLDGLPTDQIDDVFRFANAIGALTSTRKGAIPALPRVDEVRAFMR